VVRLIIETGYRIAARLEGRRKGKLKLSPYRVEGWEEYMEYIEVVNIKIGYNKVLVRAGGIEFQNRSQIKTTRIIHRSWQGQEKVKMHIDKD
jgi:hypothetical protein